MGLFHSKSRTGDASTISEHIRNIFEEGELRFEAVVWNVRIAAADNKPYDTQHYNLDVIISAVTAQPADIACALRCTVMARVQELPASSTW